MFQVVRNFLIGAVVTVALYYLLENARVDRAPRAEKFTADSSDRSASTSTSAPPADLYSFVFSDEKTPQELAFSYTNGLKASAAAGGGAGSGGGMGAPFQAYDNSTMFESFH
jgi:hypothetical protein